MSIRRIVPNIGSAKMDESKEFYSGFLGLHLATDMKRLKDIFLEQLYKFSSRVNSMNRKSVPFGRHAALTPLESGAFLDLSISIPRL
jgi:catechol 2,3-dioxygenase-like lactoylglutathione lyase family enzyme